MGLLQMLLDGLQVLLIVALLLLELLLILGCQLLQAMLVAALLLLELLLILGCQLLQAMLVAALLLFTRQGRQFLLSCSLLHVHDLILPHLLTSSHSLDAFPFL